MSRKQFAARNNIGSVLTFQKSGSTSSFDPDIAFFGSSRRVSWKLNNGSEIIQTAGTITYTGFTSDAEIRTIEMRGNSFSGLNIFYLDDDNLYGNLNLTQLSGLGGEFNVFNNPNLTGITHVPSSRIFTEYWAFNCNLTGNLNLPFSGLGGSFTVSNNPNLTGITHVPSSQIFTLYNAFLCNLTGNLNLPFSGLGGSFTVSNNPNLTGITHVPSSQIFTEYGVGYCNLTGNLDLTPFSGLGGRFQVSNNSGLTSVTHVSSSRNFSRYDASFCNLTGTLDISPLTNLGYNGVGVGSGSICLRVNPNLTDIIFPNSTQYFKNESTDIIGFAFVLDNCNLGYVDFKPLSGATLVSGATVGIPRITLQNNNMSAATVNHILVDFSGNATYNPTGWSNIDLDISGSNAAPDSSSGGYNGLAAIAFLTGSPYNWTITY
jgi:hypothetical protein